MRSSTEKKIIIGIVVAALAWAFAGCATAPEKTTGPAAKIEDKEKAYISPKRSADEKDTFSADFHVNTVENTVIQHFTITVTNEAGREVYSNTLMVEDSGILVTEPESITMPEEIYWYGRNNQGEFVSDGTYSVRFSVTDNLDNTAESLPVTVVVDNSAPNIDLAVPEKIFSPNDDGVRDTITFSIEAPVERSIESWTLTVLDGDGEQVHSRTGEGALPDTFTYPAADDSVPEEGTYRADLEAVYVNGEKLNATTGKFVVDVTAPKTEVKSTADGFSPNGDGRQESITFEQETANAGVWNAGVFPAKEHVSEKDYQSVEKSDAIMTKHWDNEAPKAFSWNGQVDGEGTLASGRYVYAIAGKDRAGNVATAVTEPFIVDMEAPKISVAASPKPFTPDGDGENDSLTIELETEDNTGIASGKVNILDPEGNTFTTFSGKGAPKDDLTWNGRAENDELVQSGEDYTARAVLTDSFGNRSTEVEQVPVGILVMKEEETGDIRIRVPSIRFVPFEADYKNLEDEELVEKNKKTLDRIAEIFKEYQDYSIRIEGHAVHIFYGDEELRNEEQEETLIPLSGKRALAVKAALVERGISADRMTVQGMGGKEPIVPHSDMENRWKNRRVEFELKKNQ